MKTERLFTLVQYKATSMVYNQSNIVSLPLVWKNTFSTFAVLPTINQAWRMVYGHENLRSTRQACFFLILNPQDSPSRQRAIDWTEQDHEPRMVLYTQSNRQERDCIYYFNLERFHKFQYSTKIAVKL